MAAGEPDPTTLADVGRDVMALLRAVVAGDWEHQAVILCGAEHSGTLRGLTEALLGVISQSLVRHMLAEACITAEDEGSPMWDALRTDLGVVLARPGVRGAMDQAVAEMQARIVAGDRPKG